MQFERDYNIETRMEWNDVTHVFAKSVFYLWKMRKRDATRAIGLECKEIAVDTFCTLLVCKKKKKSKSLTLRKPKHF